MIHALGIVEVVLRNKDTMEEESREQYTNLVLDNTYLAALNGTAIGPNIIIGTATAAMSKTNDLVNGRLLYASGYNDPATVSPQWFAPAGEMPAFVQFKQRFDPPTLGSVRNITSIALCNITPAGASAFIAANTDTIGTSFNKLHAGFILSSPCTQTDTQVLDIFYRIQFPVDQNSVIDSSHIYRAAKSLTGLRILGLNSLPVGPSISPFKIPVDSSRVTVSTPYRTNTGSYAWWTLDNAHSSISPAATITTNGRLFKRKLSWSLPLATDVGKIFNSYMFGPTLQNQSDYGSLHTVVPGYTGGSRIQPVHNHNALATVPFIDVNTLAAGSGSVVPSEVSGGWTSPSKYPELYKVNMVAGGDVGVATYNFKVRRQLGFYDNTFKDRKEIIPFFTDEAQIQNYKGKTLHNVVPASSVNHDLVDKYDIDTLLTANATGLTKANIITGVFNSWNANSIPALPVTALTDFKYDPVTKTIWVACKNTGLYKVDADTLAVTKITNIPAPANGLNCYAVDIGYNGCLWAVFNGAICKTTDAGVTWTAYHPGSVPAFNIVGISNANWSTVRSIRCDPKSSLNQMMLCRNDASQSTFWWSTAAPDVNVTARYWRALIQPTGSYTEQPLITQCAFKNGSGGTEIGTALSSVADVPAANAFDAAGVLNWQPSASRNSTVMWLGCDFGAPVNIKQFNFKLAAGSVTMTGTLVTLQYSTDGIIWRTSAYMGTSAGLGIDARIFTATATNSYALVLLTQWLISGPGPAVEFIAVRTNRYSVAAAPHSEHFICSDNSQFFRTVHFGMNFSRVSSIIPINTFFNTISFERDPVSGKTGVFFHGTDNGSGFTSRLTTSFKTEFGEHIAVNNLLNNWYSNGVLIYNAGITSLRLQYMGKGIVTYLRGTETTYTSPLLITAQVFLNEVNVDGGGPLSDIAWDSYGWNGANWVLGNTGAKITHAADSILINGINAKFTNASSGISFAAADHFTFGVCEGVFKDNATTLDGSFSFYYKKAINDVTDFSTPTVQQMNGVTGPTSFSFGSRGAVVDPNDIRQALQNCSKTSAYMNEVLFGDFEVQFTLPTGFIGGMQFGLVPANIVMGTLDDPSTDADAISAWGTTTALSTIKVKSVNLTSVKTFSSTKTYSIKRTAGIFTFLENGVVYYTSPQQDASIAWRPYVSAYSQGNSSYVKLPLANILSNGVAYATKFGSLANLSGVYDPNFFSIDDETASTVNISLNGSPVTIKFNSYAAAAALNPGEIMIDGKSGLIFFNAASVGKVITGNYTQLNNN